MEHRVEFMVDLVAIMEAVLGGEQELADGGGQAGLFEELSAQGIAGALGELNVATGEEVVARLAVSAQKNGSLADQEPSGDEFYVWFFSHVGMVCHDLIGICMRAAE